MQRFLLPILVVLFAVHCTSSGDKQVEPDTVVDVGENDIATDDVDATSQDDAPSPTDTEPPEDTDSAEVLPEDTVEAEETAEDVPTTDEKGCPLNAVWPQRILLIGNSYTGWNGGLNTVLKSMMDAHKCNPGIEIQISKHSPGGVKIYQHYEQAVTEGSALNKLLNQADGWDVVVLQDQSQIPGFPADASQEKAQTLELMDDCAVLVEATGAQLMLFMTWGRRNGDKTNDWIFPDYTAMQDKLAAGYWAYAKAAEAGAKKTVAVIPVGLAWQSVHQNSAPIAADNADDAQARFESLYSGDGSHPSMRGTYLAAAVFLEQLTGVAASLSSWTPNEISDTDKGWLDSAASAGLASDP